MPEKQANNQTNRILASIPQTIKNEVEKCAKERKSILFEAMPFSKEIIKKQDTLVDLAYQFFIDPKLAPSDYKLAKEWFPLKTIDCLPLNKKEVQEQITSLLRNSSGFCVLYIKGLKSVDDDIWADICKLKREIENRKWQEHTIGNLTEDEIAKTKNGKELYYDRNKHKNTSKAEGDPIEIRKIPGEDETVYCKYLSMELVIIGSLEKLPERLNWVQNEFTLIPLGDAKTIEQQEEKDKGSRLYKKTPVDAKWQDLVMAFPTHLEDKVDIVFKGKEKDTVLLKDLGFSDKKATIVFKPLESLILLKRFAKVKNNSILSLKDKTERTTLHAQVESLRNVLKRCFGIDGDPVPANEEGGYRLLFKAYCYDIKEKGELDTYLNNLHESFGELKKEASNTGSYLDKDRITELKQLIEACAKEIVQRTSDIKLDNVTCTGCYEKISSYILNSNNISILCNDCRQAESTNEYESHSVVQYKDNEIPRSN